MDNIAFQLPATQVKSEPPTVRKKESASDKTVSLFNRLLDRTMSSQQSLSVSDEQQTDANFAPDEQANLMSQGIANSLILALVAAPPTVMPANAEHALSHSDAPTIEAQFTGTLLSVANQATGMPLPSRLQQQNSADAQLDMMARDSTQMLANPHLATPASGKMIFIANGQAQLSDQAAVRPKQPEMNLAKLSQAELQSKLSSVDSTTVNSFNLVAPTLEIPQLSPDVTSQLSPTNLEPSQASSEVTSKLSTPQPELANLLLGEASMPDALLASEQTQPQPLILATSELPLANQPVTPLGRREQVTVKQPVGTELSSLALVQPQAGVNQQGQDDKDFLSQDSFFANHGLTELRTGKLDEPAFEAAQQMAMPNQHDIIRQIVDRARLYLRPENQSEMVLQLRPEHLGELTLKVSVESGLVSATFHSDNPEVRQVIEASLPQLKQDLSQQGIKLDSVSVFSGSEQFFDNGQRSTQQQQSVPLRKNRRELLQAIESAEEVAVSTTYGVDYRI